MKLLKAIFILFFALSANAIEILNSEKAIIIEKSDLVSDLAISGIDLVEYKGEIDLGLETRLIPVNIEDVSSLRIDSHSNFALTITYTNEFEKESQAFYYCSENRFTQKDLKECVLKRDFLRKSIIEEDLSLKIYFRSGVIEKFKLLENR